MEMEGDLEDQDNWQQELEVEDRWSEEDYYTNEADNEEKAENVNGFDYGIYGIDSYKKVILL